MGETSGRARVAIGRLHVDPLTMSETLDRLEELIAAPGVSQHVSVNAAKVVAAEDDPELRRVIAACDVVNADGMSVVWASRFLGAPLPERVTGVDVMGNLLERAARRGWGVYLLGARADVIETVGVRLRARYPSLRICGSRHGYWAPDEEREVVRTIRESGADVLFVALPTPAKEHFVGRHRHELGVRLVVGVGGSFDIVAGKTRRAPLWLQRSGLEWAFRLAQEPRRMWRRYLVGNARFLHLIGRQASSRPEDPSRPAREPR